MEQAIKRLYEIQLDPNDKERGYMPCPRCGRYDMADDPVQNALSRHATIYICDRCGMDEAIRDFTHKVLPLEEWACFE